MNIFKFFSKLTKSPAKTRKYAAAAINRLTADWVSSNNTADAELYRDLRLLRSRSRQLCINNDYARRFLKRTSTNVIGSNGIRMQIRACSKNGNFLQKANNHIMDQFNAWSKKGICTVDGRLSWIDCQKLFLETVARDGEIIIRLVKGFDNEFGFALQFIEADPGSFEQLPAGMDVRLFDPNHPNASFAEFEKEASTAVAKKIGREPSSFFVPLDVSLEQRSMTMERRGLEKLSNIAGGYLVDTDYLSNNFIELLRNKMLVKQMGARVMSGLHGDVAIPKQSGGANTFWVSEGKSPQHSQPSFAQVTLSPKSVAAYTDFTRKLVLQSSPDIENLVRNDLATVIALEIDRAAINGNGQGAEPAGILKTKGIGEVKFDDHHPINWGKIVDLESLIAAKNADIGNLGYLCNAAMRGVLKQKEKADHTAQFIWEGNGAEPGFGYLNGYRVGTTNQMPADTLLFGNFGDLIIGQWGVLDVLVDPYTLGTSGGIRIRVMQDVDIAVRHSESFAVLKK